VLYVPHYAAVPWVLSQTRLLAVLPASVAAQFCERFPLSSVPLQVGRTLTLQQLWHPRAQLLPAHRWLRDQVTACAARREDYVLATSSSSALAGGRRPSVRPAK
jgi:DNA-binding transcriptional LysR family regulator